MLKIKSFVFSPIQENTYLLYNEFNQCAMGFSKCSEKKPCAFHGEFKKSRKIIEVLLIEKKISDLGKANSLFNEI